MRTVNLHEAKARLSQLVRAAANGEPFIIARAGKPLVKVVAVDAEAGTTLADELDRIARHCASLPRRDPRSADEILGYDDRGLPT